MSGYGPVLITGGGGMLGAPLARRCLADGADVHILSRGTAIPPRLASLGAQVRMHHIDWDAAGGPAEVLAAVAPRTVFHLAGIRLNPGAQLADYIASGVGLMTRLLEALSVHPRIALVYASSGAVYGDHALVAESSAVEPASWLGATKAMAEQLAMAEARLRSRRFVGLRLFTPFGPEDDPERLIVAAVRAAGSGAPFAVNSGRQTRDFVYIDDVVEAFVRSASLRQAKPQILNIGSGHSRSVRSVVEHILNRLGRPDLARFSERESLPGDIEVMHANITRARDVLGWSPRVTFAAGIDRVIRALDMFPLSAPPRDFERTNAA